MVSSARVASNNVWMTRAGHCEFPCCFFSNLLTLFFGDLILDEICAIQIYIYNIIYNIYIYNIIYIYISFPTISLLPFFVIESMSEFLNGPSQFHQFLPLENYHQSWKCETEPSNETVFIFQPIKCHQKILRIQSDICNAFGHRRKPPPGTCKAPRMTHVCNVMCCWFVCLASAPPWQKNR